MRLDEPPYFYQCKKCKRRFTVRRKKHTINLLIIKLNKQKCPSRTRNIDDIIKAIQ